MPPGAHTFGFVLLFHSPKKEVVRLPTHFVTEPT